MSDTIVVIQSRSRVLRVARELGLTPVHVRPPNWPDPHVGKELCPEVVTTDLLDEDGAVEVLEDLYERYRPVRVVTLSEDGLLPSARVNERHGLGGNSVRTVRLLKDKWAMRQRLAELGLSPVVARVVSSAAELREFVAGLGGPAIVKPLDAGGSKGIVRVPGAEDADAVWAEVVAGGRDRMLAEEYLEGPEVSVEGFTVNGKHTVVAITDKVLGPRYIEIGHVVPAAVDDELRAQIVELTAALLDAVGLVEGPSHTEFKLTPTGPRIVESHNRIGGDNITDLVRDVYGVDFERLTMSVPLGIEEWDGAVPAPRGGSAIRYFIPPEGVVRDVRRPADDELPPGVTLNLTAEPGLRIPPLLWSMDRVAGYVRAVTDSAASAIDACERAVAATRIEVEPAE